eukprot:m.72844 g.72844  ORF g.72844 m.72844 type:complete len:682 (-) comp14286_c0_seq1:136-2181(-)
MTLLNMTNATAMNHPDSSIFGSLPIPDVYAALVPKFAQFHQDPANIAAHMITTPLGFVAAVCIFNRLTNTAGIGAMIASFYVLALIPVVSPAVFYGTAITTAIIILAAARLKLSVIMSLVLLIISYFLQDLAHYLTGEATFQSTYSAGGHVDFANLELWASMFYEHVYFLLPLCVEVALPTVVKTATPALPAIFLGLYQHMMLLVPLSIAVLGNYGIDSDAGFFPFSFVQQRVVQCTVGARALNQLALIRDWVTNQNPTRKTTSHWWYSTLPAEPKAAFDNVASCEAIMSMFHAKFTADQYYVDVVKGMNEIYISAPNAKGTSDEVFYTEHVDGPIGLYPFCSVYRCIVGMDANRAYATHFPMAGFDKAVGTGNVLGFDFHREPHFLSRTETAIDPSLPQALGGDGRRVVLKIHYSVYPRGFALLGYGLHVLSVLYNTCFRALFLATIKPPETFLEVMSGQVVVQFTRLVNTFQRVIGFQNALYLAVLAVVASPMVLNEYAVFLVGTSFIHYLRYITTYYHRTGVSFEAFKRDVLLFKTLSIGQLGYLYLQHFDFAAPDVLSVSMIAVGYTLSILATKALGIDRTYFGVELGFCEPKWITDFPYGVVPHPMIVSQILALGGFLKLAAFRAVVPWLVPCHIGLYLCHMLQEHFDVHQGGRVNLGSMFSMGGVTEQVLRKKVQ